MPVAADLYYYAFESRDAKNLPVVLIHGAGGNRLSWPPEIRRLLEHNVYALDLPGHGKSGGCGEQSIDAYARQVVNWMQAIDLHRAFIVGHSMGGAIALTLGINHPRQVLGLGLIGTGARLRVSQKILESIENPATVQAGLDNIIAWSFSPDTSPRLTELASKRFAETRPSVLRGDFLACNSFNVTSRLANITRPVLVICGDQDKMTPLRYSQLLAKKIPRGSLSVIPDAGHMVMLEQPQAVADSLVTFLRETYFHW